MDSVQLSVCTTCRDAGDASCTGEAMHEALRAALPAFNLHINPIECFCVCTKACTIAVSAPGKWSYVIGGLNPARDMGELLQYLAVYAASEHGTPPLKERPAAIRRGTIARIPPLAS